MAILMDGNLLRMDRNYCKRVIILFLFVAGAGLRAWKRDFRGRRRESRGGREVTFRGRWSTLCALNVGMGKDSWQAQGIVRL